MSESTISSPTPSRSQLTIWLGYLGLIPFFTPLWQMINAVNDGAGIHAASLLGLYAPYVFITYSAIILSFLGGVLWAKGRFNQQQKISKAAIIFSNLMALSAWASLIMPISMVNDKEELLCRSPKKKKQEDGISSHKYRCPSPSREVRK